MPVESGVIELIGIPLSVVATIVLILLLIDWARRGSQFAEIQLGPVHVEPGVARWVWLMLLLGGYLLGSSGPVIATRTDSSGVRQTTAAQTLDEDRVEGARTRVDRGFRVGVPFYRFERTVSVVDGAPVNQSTSRGLQLPVWFILVVLLYRVVVMRHR